MSTRLQHHDVERMLRDVLNRYGVRIAALSVEQVPAGWHVTITDGTARIWSTDVQDGPPAVVRVALTNWVLNQL